MNALIASLLEQGAPYLMLSLAVPFVSAFFIYFFMRKLLQTRLNLFALLGMALVYTLWYNLRSPDLFGTGYHLFMNIFINVWQYFIIIFLFKGKFWKKLIVWWYFDIVKTMCQAAAYVPVLLYHTGRGTGSEWAQVLLSVETDVAVKLLHTAAFLPLFVLMGYLSLAIWRRILMQKFYPFYLLFIALPMGLRYSFARVIRPNMGDMYLVLLVGLGADTETAYYILSLYGIAVAIAASVAILYYILSDDKRTAIEAELREAKRVMEREQAQYSEMERRSEELERIRHDFNNQLSSIIQLVHAGEDGTAREIVGELTYEINGK